ncbi:MAG: nitrous oxide reductase family maturation protein NosD [Chitinophagaceae bacterium]
MKQLITILFIFSFLAGHAGTIEVGRDRVVSSLKKAVELAQDGDTILLHKGTYKEGNIIITKSIRLIGVDNPVLDGEGEHELLTVSGTEILVKGITFANSGYSSMDDYAALKIIDASYIIVENNTINNAFFAIHVANATKVIIRNNTIKTFSESEQISGNGIHLWKCSDMLISDNHIEGHRDGIYFEFVYHSFIQNNHSEKNIRYGLHFMFSNNNSYLKNTFVNNGAGVAVMYSKDVLMHSNTFDRNWGAAAYGLLLKDISNSQIINNHFVQNTMAILMEGTARIDVFHNVFRNNGWAMKVQANCTENEFHHNNFLANTFDVATNGHLALNHFYNNYWDKYEGYDMDRNRIGDIPYHPVSMYSMVIEQNSNAVILMRSFMVTLLDKAEKAIPSLTPENLVDTAPYMKPIKL